MGERGRHSNQRTSSTSRENPLSPLITTIALDAPTRDGTGEIHVLTNLPAEVSAAMIAEVYRDRWRIEGAFHELEAAIRGEVETLGHPKAARLAFGVVLAAFNVLQVVKAAIGAGHGIDAGAEVDPPTLGGGYASPGFGISPRSSSLSLRRRRGSPTCSSDDSWLLEKGRDVKELAGEYERLTRLVRLPRC